MEGFIALHLLYDCTRLKSKCKRTPCYTHLPTRQSANTEPYAHEAASRIAVDRVCRTEWAVSTVALMHTWIFLHLLKQQENMSGHEAWISRDNGTEKKTIRTHFHFFLFSLLGRFLCFWFLSHASDLSAWKWYSRNPHRFLQIFCTLMESLQTNKQ